MPTDDSHQFDPERLALLMRAVKALSPVRFEGIREPFNAEPRVGQLWRAWCGPRSDDETDPSPDVLLVAEMDFGGTVSADHFRAVPAFPEVEHMGPYDLLLPDHVLGSAWALALDSTFTVDVANLHSCLGRLNDEWMDRVAFALENERCIIRGGKEDPELIWGWPCGSDSDFRIKWHDLLLDQMQPMQMAALARYEEAMTESELPQIIPFVDTPVGEVAHLRWDPKVTRLAYSMAAEGTTPIKDAEFDVPGQDCFIRISVEKETAWFIVFGIDQNRTSKIDHWRVFAQATNVAEFLGARANCREDLLFGGFHLIAPDGTAHFLIPRGDAGNT